jgi:hypothetical protein
MNYTQLIITLGIAFAVISLVFVLLPTNNPDPEVIKILSGGLPECNETNESTSGEYCLINNITFFCKVDSTAQDPFVKTHAYCSEVYWE